MKKVSYYFLTVVVHDPDDITKWQECHTMGAFVAPSELAKFIMRDTPKNSAYPKSTNVVLKNITKIDKLAFDAYRLMTEG